MIRMFARHDVRDFDFWYQGYKEATQVRTEGGVKADGIFQNVDKPEDVTVWHDFDDAATARAFISQLEAMDVLPELGVIGKPDIWYTNKIN